MGKLKKLLLVAVISVLVATPIVRDKLKAQYYLEHLSSGVVLEATQRLRGAVFKNTRVLLIDYLPEGATGVVLSESVDKGIARYQKLKQTAGVEQRTQRLMAVGAEHNDIFWGGPVAQGHLFWVGYEPERLRVSMSDKPPITRDEGPLIAARFAGYVGWSKHQLAQEVLNGDWRITQANPERLSTWLLANKNNK